MRRRLTSSQEFDTVGEDETIYKLIGPVLLKQDKMEAESTVKGRLDFIGNEMCAYFPQPAREASGWKAAKRRANLHSRRSRIEGQIKETQQKMEAKKTEIVQTQAAAQMATTAPTPQPTQA